MTVLPADTALLRAADTNSEPALRRSCLAVRPAAYVWPTLLFLGAGFALANGLGYGSGNQWQYLLHGRHAADPTFLANDWLTLTRAHHAAFHACLGVLGRFAALDVALGLANALAALIYAVCIYAIAGRFYRNPILVTAIVLLLIVFSPQSAIGQSKNVHNYFEPSTIGAIGLLAAFVLVAAGRYWGAAVCILVASVFHLNYMIWAGLIFGAVVVLNWRQLGLRNSVLLLLPVAIAAVYQAPFFLASQAPDQRAAYHDAARILHDLYMPAQSRPRTWGWEPFFRFASILAAGGLAWFAVPAERRPGQVVLTMIGAVAAIVGVGIFFTLVVPIDAVALLFPYRLAPLLILASWIATAGALVTTATTTRLSLLKTVGLWCALGVLIYAGGLNGTYALAMIGVALTILLAGRMVQEVRLPGYCAIALGVGLLALLALGGAGNAGLICAGIFVIAASICAVAPSASCIRTLSPMIGSAGRAALPLLVGVLLMHLGAVRKDFLGPPPPADERLLYDWCRTRTGRSDVFVIPPQLAGFRLGAERAIVVDARCIPVLPRDTMEWYRRLKDECGADFDSLGQTEVEFASLTADRARLLADAYGAEYLVTRNGRHRGDLGDLPRLYANPAFSVYHIAPPVAKAAR
jgi:hypothetical protein